MNTSNITNYKPKDFAELLGVSVKTLQIISFIWVSISEIIPSYEVETADKILVFNVFISSSVK